MARNSNPKKRAAFFCLTLFTLMGCVHGEGRARPEATQYRRVESHAIPQTERTQLGDAIAKTVQENPGKSGFRIFHRGSSSLLARLALVRMAEKTLDLQYYAVADDKTSNLMMEALILAAKRGVRVRLLVDSFTVNDMKPTLLAFDGLENIEIRVFNPLTTRDQSPLSRLASVMIDLPYANKRMHNKALISDNQMAIMGGRNLSDEYFDADADMEFRDIDVLSAGPITNEISKSFDHYWNDKNAFPISAVYKPLRTPKKAQKIREKLENNWNSEIKNPIRKQQLTSALPEILANPDLKLTWAKAELAVDSPSKITEDTTPLDSPPLQSIVSLLDKAHKEFLVISAYFVPKDEGVEWLAGLEARGIHVRVLTNSLASTDVVAVHSGYAPYRVALLQKGIELFELIPVGDKRPRQRLIGRSQPPRAGLHSKAYVIDDTYTIIGSFNLDPRSVELNTEMALVIESPELSAEMKKSFERIVQPDISYRVMLDDSGKELRWQGIENGKKMRYDHEPRSGVMRTIQNFLFNRIPFEDQL